MPASLTLVIAPTTPQPTHISTLRTPPTCRRRIRRTLQSLLAPKRCPRNTQSTRSLILNWHLVIVLRGKLISLLLLLRTVSKLLCRSTVWRIWSLILSATCDSMTGDHLLRLAHLSAPLATLRLLFVRNAMKIEPCNLRVQENRRKNLSTFANYSRNFVKYSNFLKIGILRCY